MYLMFLVLCLVYNRYFINVSCLFFVSLCYILISGIKGC